MVSLWFGNADFWVWLSVALEAQRQQGSRSGWNVRRLNEAKCWEAVEAGARGLRMPARVVWAVFCRGPGGATAGAIRILL